MSPPPLQSVPPASGLPWLDVLLSCSTLLGPVLGWLAASRAASSSSRVQLEKTVLDASRLLVESGQRTHSADGVLISGKEAEIVRLRQDLRQHQQWIESVVHWATREKLTLPSLDTLESRYRGNGP